MMGLEVNAADRQQSVWKGFSIKRQENDNV